MRRQLEVRYSECDMQRVVHNSVYLRWCDDVADHYFRDIGAGLEDDWWDVMVKSATVTWAAPAKIHDLIEIDMAVSRWGNTSFDVTFTGTRAGEAIFEAVITYVAVRTGTLETVAVPADFRAAADAV